MEITETMETKEMKEVTLRDITRENYLACLDLRVREDQRAFVASNAFSLAQSKYEPECIPLAVYAGEIMVGFTMYCVDTDVNTYYIYRLMIDEKHQGKGYGLKAMSILLDMIKKDPCYHRIYIDCRPENTAAQRLYAKLGFQRTDEWKDGDSVYMHYDY